MVSVDGALGLEATYYLKQLSEHICLKLGKSYGEVIGWLRAILTVHVIVVDLNVYCMCEILDMLLI